MRLTRLQDIGARLRQLFDQDIELEQVTQGELDALLRWLSGIPATIWDNFSIDATVVADGFKVVPGT